MGRIGELWRRMMFFLRRGQFHRDLEEEMRLHQDLRAQAHAESGMAPEDAQYAAKREFGNALLLREKSQDIWGWRWLEELFQDLRFGLRQLRRNPGFTAVAVLTLALGIGANSAMFSVVNAVLLRPLPFHDPGRLVWIQGIPAVKIAHLNGLHNWIAGWEDWVSKTRTLEGVSVYETGGINLSGGRQPEHLPAAAVSANFLRLLGVEAVRGRTFLPQEEGRGRAVAVISYDLWQERFGADPGIIGKTLELAGRPFIVIGVMPPKFEFPDNTQIWVPNQANVAVMLFGQQVVMSREIARLRPGITPEQARNELLVFLRQMKLGHQASSNPKLSVIPLRLELTETLRPSLLILMGAVGLVLLIACADVANLLMARNTGRQHEIAIRIAVGANRWRLVRQMLTESLLLSLFAGGVGLLIGDAGVQLARALIPANQIAARGIRLDGWVLIFTSAVAVLTGVVSGLLPAFGASKVRMSEALKEAGRGKSSIGWNRCNWLRVALGSGEVALAFILLIGAGLLIKGLLTLSEVNPGFRSDHLLTARLFLTEPGYKSNSRRADFFEEIIDRARRLPGVSDAAFINSIPMGRGGFAAFSVGIEGSPTPKPQTSGKFALYFNTSSAYFRAMGIPLLAGREFNERDRQGSLPVVIISQTAAQQFWSNQNLIGKRITLFDPPQWMTVVGVVGDVHPWSLSEKPWPSIYMPVSQHPPQSAFLVLHTSGPVSAGDVARVVHSVDREEPVASVRTVQQLLARSTAEPRFRTEVLSIFAGLAVLLAVIGIYGVVSYSVSQRTHEIGIRMALGAQKTDVLRLVLGQGMVLALVGVGIGIVGALGLTRFLSSMLYGIKPTDPLTFVIVSLVLTGVALLACYIPARRATKIDPMEALRYE